ncbi:hypothetical protein ANCCEY_03114 [Ancylostoma ceylanicum]|uniref:Uncharacterized protein n=1 Tax=Ancylostoma ceylanicum TaxID=53326 RepID=A0A0D6M613_9BILA|nr:hypothetical protein ANCCEY_03114 [Ancylostoma ceylanicum]
MNVNLAERNRVARHARLQRHVSIFTEGSSNNKENESETVENLVKPSWIFTAPSPFLKTDLRDLAENWQPRTNVLYFQEVTSLYRFNLLQVTSPPQEIQQYAYTYDDGATGFKWIPCTEAPLLPPKTYRNGIHQ